MDIYLHITGRTLRPLSMPRLDCQVKYRRACVHGDIDTGPHQVVSATLVLFQLRGADYAHHKLMSPPSFVSHMRALSKQESRRPSIIAHSTNPVMPESCDQNDLYLSFAALLFTSQAHALAWVPDTRKFLR